MRSLKRLAIAVALVLSVGAAQEASAQIVYYASRPVVVDAGYPYYYPAYGVPTYRYYGGWYPGSYQNIYGNYGAYHVMSPIWTGGYTYYYR